MKIYRGPASTGFHDDSHELVSEVKPTQLTESIATKAHIQFNITKDGPERSAVCTAELDDADILALSAGVTARLRAAQECLVKISVILEKHELGFENQIYEIERAIAPLRTYQSVL